MRNYIMWHFLPFTLVLLLITSCHQPCKNNSLSLDGDIRADLNSTYKIDNRLYEFILSRLYVLSGDTLPTHNVIIEFALCDNDTMFEVSILSDMHKDFFNKLKLGCVNTDDFRLFVLDNDAIGSMYYQIDSVWSGVPPYEHTICFPVIGGIISQGVFFELPMYLLDYRILENSFVLYHKPPLR